MPGRESVRPEKLKAVDDLAFKIDKYPVVGILNIHKLPANAMQNVRSGLGDRVEIKIIKKNILMRAFEKVAEKKKLEEFIGAQPALLLTEMNPFKLYKFLDRNKTPASAKPGDKAIKDIEVNAGPTDLMPGPAISALAAVKIPAKVEGGKIAILGDKVVAKEGDEISPELAGVLQMLKIEPMEVGLDLVAVFEDGTIYTKDILAVDEDQILADMIAGYHQAINLSIETGFIVKEAVTIMISKAFNEARSLALEAGVVSKDIIGELLAKAVAEMKAVEKQVGELKVEEPKAEEKSEETPKEEEKKEETKEEVKEEKSEEKKEGD